MTILIRRPLAATVLLAAAGLLCLAAPVLGQTPAKTTSAAATRPDARPAASQVDDPNLPRVLILGDSISMGYTGPVQKLLKGKANVHRPPDNCQHTAYGLAHLKQWLGAGKWDVIHFNFGIWDTHYLNKTTGGLVLKEDNLDPATVRLRHTPEQYRENLANIIKTLHATGAQLVWASTTPIMSRTGERFEDIRRLNDVAAGLMKESGIPVNDLYSLVLPDIAKWQSADKCHFNAQGNNLLAEKVAQAILDALAARVKSPATQPVIRPGPGETPAAATSQAADAVPDEAVARKAAAEYVKTNGRNWGDPTKASEMTDRRTGAKRWFVVFGNAPDANSTLGPPGLFIDRRTGQVTVFMRK